MVPLVAPIAEHNVVPFFRNSVPAHTARICILLLLLLLLLPALAVGMSRR